MSEKPDAAVMVSDVIGEGDDAHRLVRVEAWSFKIWEAAGDKEPRIRDVDAAERLGFAEARAIRKLIKRIWPGDKIKGIYVRDTVSRTSMPRGGHREGKNPEYWLTEAQLLMLIARCETEIAVAILQDMIRVYMLVRRGLLLSAAPAPSLAQVRTMLAQQIIPAAVAAENADEARRAWAALNALLPAPSRTAQKPNPPKPSRAPSAAPAPHPQGVAITASTSPPSSAPSPAADAPELAAPTTRGKALKALRKELGMTQEGMAAKGGLGRVEVVRVESGYNEARTYRMRAGLARAADLGIEDLSAYLDGKIDLAAAMSRRSSAMH